MKVLLFNQCTGKTKENKNFTYFNGLCYTLDYSGNRVLNECRVYGDYKPGDMLDCEFDKNGRLHVIKKLDSFDTNSFLKLFESEL